MALVGLVGKSKHGKDTVALIIQWLVFQAKSQDKSWTLQDFLDSFDTLIHSSSPNYDEVSGWQKKMFAGKVKQIISLLIGCSLEDLENQEFKERPLGEEWDIYRGTKLDNEGKIIHTVLDTKEAQKEFNAINENGGLTQYISIYKISMTPRLLLQLIGTDCGRNIIHPNLWVNALFSEYKDTREIGSLSSMLTYPNLPNWIITDVRFPNECQAIKDRQGLIFKVYRPGQDDSSTHPSETSLDHYSDEQFDGLLLNNGSIDVLVDQVKIILKHYKII